MARSLVSVEVGGPGPSPRLARSRPTVPRRVAVTSSRPHRTTSGTPTTNRSTTSGGRRPAAKSARSSGPSDVVSIHNRSYPQRDRRRFLRCQSPLPATSGWSDAGRTGSHFTARSGAAHPCQSGEAVLVIGQRLSPIAHTGTLGASLEPAPNIPMMAPGDGYPLPFDGGHAAFSVGGMMGSNACLGRCAAPGSGSPGRTWRFVSYPSPRREGGGSLAPGPR